MARKRRSAKQRNKINPANLAPLIREGFTEGASAEEAFQEHPYVKTGDARQRARVLLAADARAQETGFAGFVADDDEGAVWTDGVTDRVQLDIHKTYTEEGMRRVKAGYQCLRCDEPQEYAFPMTCSLCGYAMHDRQIMDIAMEFEGRRHIGPSKPITEYMEEQDSRVEKRKFIKKLVQGGQGKIPKEWLRDATLLDGLTPNERQMIGA